MTAVPSGPSPVSPEIAGRARRSAILAQCLGLHAMMAFQNNLVLLYLLALGIPEARVVGYLAIPMGLQSVMMMPAAYFADRIGKKKVGGFGIALSVVGFIILTLAATTPMPEVAGVAGIALYATGATLFGAGWFALLDPVVPQEIRGRFFANLRIAWQLAGLLVSGCIAAALAYSSTLTMFQILIGIMTLFLLLRAPFYRKIPEVEKPQAAQPPFRTMLGTVIRREGYVSYGSYLFLLTTFTVSAPGLFSLVETKVIRFDPDSVVWLANIMLLGNILGFFVGGRAVDRWGTKPVFLLCHFWYALLLGGFLMRGMLPGHAFLFLAAIHFGWGLCASSLSIAVTTEMLALMPDTNKSFATALLNTLQRGGAAASGFLIANALDLGAFRAEWTLAGFALSRYDTILLGCAIMILMLVVTLGLVPSVLKRKAEWYPR